MSFICWAIWKDRCRYVYEGKQPSPMSTIRVAENLASEYKEAGELLVASEPCPSSAVAPPKKWCPPPQGFVKVNTDVAWSSSSEVGLGVVMRDSNGVFVDGAASRTTSPSLELAEAEAILLGVTMARSRDIQKVIIESDSQNIIRDINHPNCGSWKTYPIVHRIRSACRFFSDVKWNWVPRDANCAAHHAASHAIRIVGLERWASVPPRSLSFVLLSDILPSPAREGTGIG